MTLAVMDTNRSGHEVIPPLAGPVPIHVHLNSDNGKVHLSIQSGSTAAPAFGQQGFPSSSDYNASFITDWHQ